MSTSQQRQLKILIVDDDEDDFLLIKEHFEKITAWQLQLDWIPRYDEAVAALIENRYTLCFSDYRLGLKNGIDLINEIRQKNSVTPVILLTGKGNYKIDMEATRAGAFDYLVKDELDEDKLERTLRYSLERIQNLEKITESERLFRNFFERSIDIVFIARQDTSIITINAAAKDLLKIPSESSVHDQKLIDFFSDLNTRQLFLEGLEQDGEVENFEVQLITAANEIVHCLINASLEKNDGNSSYVQGVIHNITDIKKAEAAALQSEKLAATGRFIHTLAHEVRNPLKNIRMAVQQLQHPANKVADKLLLEIVDRSEVKIDNLITELLQSAQTAEIDLQKTSLKEVIISALADVRDKLTLRNIHLVLQSDDDVEWMIKADNIKLKMALLNMIVNAIEAVQDETGKIEIILKNTNGKAELQIKDNGTGISPENKSRLFEPYFTSKRNGIGLGLATTLNILQLHHAQIEVDSFPGAGSTFRIFFPLV